MTQPTPNPEITPAVPGELDRLAATIDEMDTTIQYLLDHISPVLRPEQPQPAPPVSAAVSEPAPASVVANRLRTEIQHADALVYRLRTTIGRIDL